MSELYWDRSIARSEVKRMMMMMVMVISTVMMMMVIGVMIAFMMT